MRKLVDVAHGIKPKSKSGYEGVLAPVRTELGHVAVRKLTRQDIDALVTRLRDGQVERVLRAIREDRNRHCWHLALSGLRRGEIGGLRWTNIDLEAKTLTRRPDAYQRRRQGR